MRLQGKVVIVTGATKGIGRVIAATMADEGAKVVITGRTVKRGEAIVDDLRKNGGDAMFVAADVGNPEDAKKSVQAAIDTYGKLTTLVNNAAPTDLLARADSTVADISLDAWNDVIKVTLTGAMLMSKYSIPRMVEAGGGSIINISSDAADRASRAMAAYSAAKAGLNSLTRSIALENGAQNIRANTILVGQIMPPQALGVLEAHPIFGPHVRAAHLTRLGRREDIAAGVVYLASDEAGFVTGAAIPIDGGARIISNLLGKELLDGSL